VRSLCTTVALGAIALTGCTDELPTVETVAGSYTATVFTVKEGAAPTRDILTEGGFINLGLDVAGTTTGQLFAPDAAEDGGDFDADLTGTWALDSVTVTFDHSADTFIRDIPFTVEGNRLVGEATFSGAAITVELSRQ
jgi:hypothetical protein